ncbi:response regulator [Caulobacter sp. SLTY]|uniref:ATP-binding protein n=1 Tax=Caulobacter sp. SLTY TaxID=2683262 RepID=UPI001411E517|nr:ATP-binding protein [Caulobacter sp. SLTY]NBB17322.1 response regulator [Caulobacter sp. SLTY]
MANLDLVAQDSRRLLPSRVIAALAMIWLISPILGAASALGWVVAILLVEGLTFLITRGFREGATASNGRRRLYLVAAVGGNATWLALSWMFWHSPQEGTAFLALLIWAALLLNAVSYAFRSAVGLMIFAIPTIGVMLLMPALAPRFTGPSQRMVMVGLALCCAFAMVSAWRNVRAARALAASRAALDAERARAEDANSAKSAFLAFMSHEIRTPLNGVLGMVQAMDRDELSPAQRERLAVVAGSGETLLLLLNDLLDLSRIEAGRLDLEDGVVDLAAIAEEARRPFTHAAGQKGVTLRLDAPAETLGWWKGDPARIKQIITNLVANAVKFTEAGEVVVILAREPGGVSITVRDTGAGIAPDRLDHLFDRFVQAEAATSRQYGGSGLGLAICRQLAELMGGSIGAQSRLGEGSCFTVRLPLARAEAPPAAIEPRAADPEGVDLRILVAEDNATNRLVLTTLLEQVGLCAHLVENGREAVEAHAAAYWDVVLMDVQMPVMDGPTAVRAIRERERAEGLAYTPIIALTANAMAHHKAEYLAAGMDAMVAKPIQLTQLLGVMQQVMDTAQARQAA